MKASWIADADTGASIRPTADSPCASSQLTTPTCKLAPTRAHLVVSSARALAGRAGAVCPGQKPMRTSRSLARKTRRSPPAALTVCWSLYADGGKRCSSASHLARSWAKQSCNPTGAGGGRARGAARVKGGSLASDPRSQHASTSSHVSVGSGSAASSTVSKTGENWRLAPSPTGKLHQ